VLEQKILALTLVGSTWVLYLLIGLSVISVTVMLERAVYFLRRQMSGQFDELLKLIRVAAESAPGGLESVEKAIASTIDRRKLQYEQWLFVLGTLGNNAPFIGLFGTVLGIIKAFADLAIAQGGGVAGAGGQAAAASVMRGVSEALTATAVGLFVAIPAVLAYNIFLRLLKRVVGRSNALSNAIAAGLHAQNTRANGAAAKE